MITIVKADLISTACATSRLDDRAWAGVAKQAGFNVRDQVEELIRDRVRDQVWHEVTAMIQSELLLT
jgi:hypothetical protein